MKYLLLILFLCSVSRAGIIDTTGPADSLYHPLVDIYDFNGLQRGTSSNPIFTGRTWSLLSSTDSVGSVQQGSWSLLNITGTVSLPTGASTSALQTTGNATLTAISSQLPPSLGVKVASASLSVVQGSFLSRVLTTSATTTLKTGAGVLQSLVVSGAGGGAISIYDGTSAAGTLILQATGGTASGGLLSGSGNPGPTLLGPLGIAFTTGLTVVTSGSTTNAYTVVYF